MKKEFYIGQPLIIKKTGEKVVFYYNDGDFVVPYNVVGDNRKYYKEHHELEPSTEFKFSELMAGLEQGYFEVGTEFRLSGTDRTIKVKQGNNGLLLERFGEHLILTSEKINSTWILVEHHKEMTIEEIEAELGYKIKLKDK